MTNNSEIATNNADFAEIKRLVKPGSRQQLKAQAKLRALAIIEAALQGKRSQPSELELKKLVREVKQYRTWQDLFPGVASLQIATEGTGLQVSLRITKRQGELVQLVPEGTPDATVVAVKRVNELDFYNLSTTQLADNLGLTTPKTVALVRYLELQKDEKYYKEIRVNKVRFKQYSQEALRVLKEALGTVDMDDVWKNHSPHRSRVTSKNT